MQRFSARQAFTLIEILVVVAIIGILASIVLIGVGPAQSKADDARRVSDLQEIQTGLELYYTKTGSYPLGDFAAMASALQQEVGINNVPKDPKNVAPYVYQYVADPTGSTYVLSAYLEDVDNPVFENSVTNATLPPTIPPGSIDCDPPYYCVTL